MSHRRMSSLDRLRLLHLHLLPLHLQHPLLPHPEPHLHQVLPPQAHPMSAAWDPRPPFLCLNSVERGPSAQ